MKILETIKQPYPFCDDERSNWENTWRSFLVGLFIAFFLFIFEPFGISRWQDPNKFLYILGFGGVTFVSLLFMRLVVIKLLPNYYNESSWTVGKEILMNSIILVVVALGNYLYTAIIYINQWTVNALLYSFLTVFSIGIFPISFSVLVKFYRELKKYGQSVSVNRPIHQDAEIVLTADNEKDKIQVKSDQLFYIESADNYCNVFFDSEGQIRNELLRSSLSRIECQLEKNNLVRCHRSFIVNLDQVEKVTGNAQGYKLHLKQLSKKIPVARKYSHIMESLR